jgi:predicted RNase H-like nuclease
MNPNPATPDLVGVDGCRESWIAVFRRSDGLQYAIHRTFAGLMAAFPSDARLAWMTG